MKRIIGCTAAVLCGGKSVRMGFDKALLQIEGEYVLPKTVKHLEALFQKVLLITNDREKFPSLFLEHQIKEDAYLEKGPLGGLVTALENLETDYLFLIACDIPVIKDELVYKMAQYTKNYEVVICKQENRLEPLFAFYSASCLPIFQKQLSTNDWRIRKNFHQFLVKEIVLDGSYELRNVNTPEELALWNQ